MKHLAALAAALALTAAAPAPSARPLPVGKTLTWRADAYPRPIRLQAGSLTLAVRPLKRDGLVGPAVTVSQPGRSSATVEGEIAGLTFPNRVTVLRWNRAGDLFLLLESFSGGAHCCASVQAVVPDGARFRTVEIGEFDGDRLQQLPADLDGDGAVDFVGTDDRFLYAFASYADSLAPPKIVDIVAGKAVDVSARPAFRPLFAHAMAEARKGCAKPRNSTVNGDCAAYVANAARAGRFEQAWAEMLHAYDRKAHDFPEGCRVPMTEDADCPKAQKIRYATYPEALRAFLIRTGYIAR